MKVYFTRHGESTDDIDNQYGGWADFPLTPKGVQSAKEVGRKLKNQNIKAEIILTSPLLRAKQTAVEIGKILNFPAKEIVYLKERNTYGLLSGLNKEEAKKIYPDLAKAYENEEDVDGYEPYDQFLSRVKKLIDILAELNFETIICITHGKLLKALCNDIIGKKAKEFEDNCVLEVKVDKAGNVGLMKSEGVVFA